jgi:prepilin-type N-terminal cleavage/methylation domain-containing protein
MNAGALTTTGQGNRAAARRSPAVFGAFTLLELLAVISILGILAALSLPALRNFGKSDATISAGQQLLRDIGRARQLAISDHTTVYMVFVPTNFWGNAAWFSHLSPADRMVMTDLCDYQLTGYNFVADGALGDQPGNHQWHYLASWQNLPQGTFIPTWKFAQSNTTPFVFSDPATPADYFKIYPFYPAFSATNTIPFPSETATNDLTQPWPWLPYIAFNYLGQLIMPQYPDQDYTGVGVDIPLAKGSVMAAANPATKALQLAPAQTIETPPGNDTNITYDVIHIDPLTGRATLLYHVMQ